MGPDDDSDLYGTSNVAQTHFGHSPTSTGNVSTSSQVAHSPPVLKKLESTHSSITKMKEPLDETNWVVWRERIHRIFYLCGVEPYVYG